jgi:quinol monooxygenase YgiN
MLIVAVEFRMAPDTRDAFLALARELTGPTRAEEGCDTFEFWGDLDDPGRFFLFEIWESERHLEAHRDTPHVAAFKAGIADLGLDAVETQRFEARSLS